MNLSPYRPGDELLDRLERIRLLLGRALEVRATLAEGQPGGSLRRFLLEGLEPGFVARPRELESALAAVDAHVAARSEGHDTPFARLQRLLALDSLESDLLLAAVAPAFRRAFREGLQLLGPEVAPGLHPVAHLVELVAWSAESYAWARAALDDGGRLTRSGALLLREPAPQTPPLFRSVAPSLALLRWLDSRPSPYPTLDLERPGGALVEPTLGPPLDELAQRSESAGPAARLVVVGEPGRGRTRLAAALARRMGREAAVIQTGAPIAPQLLDARLRGRLVYLPLGERPLDRELPPLLAALDLPCVVSADPRSPSLVALDQARFSRLHLHRPSQALQLEAWRHALAVPVDEAALAELPRRHPLDLGDIEAAAAAARSQAAGGPPLLAAAAAAAAAQAKAV